MTHVKVMHWGRKWPRPKNHLDGRVCPECSTTVHGDQAQHTHQRWHLDLQEVLDSKRSVLADDYQAPSIPWTAAVDERDDREAISDGPEAS